MHFSSLFFAAGMLLAASLASATESDLVTKPSAADVPTTMDRLESMVRQKGLTVFARIDHQANAAAVAMEMPAAELLVFGNPKLGTRIMQDDVRAGLDLPLRVLVYEDVNGNTQLSYHRPDGLRATYDVAGNPAIDTVAGALDKMTSAATQ